MSAVLRRPWKDRHTATFGHTFLIAATAALHEPRYPHQAPELARCESGLLLCGVCMCVAGVSEGRDPAAELTEDDPREHKAKHQIEQVR